MANRVSVDTTWQWHPIPLLLNLFSQLKLSFSWYHLAVASNLIGTVARLAFTLFQLIPLGSGIQSGLLLILIEFVMFQLIPLGSGIQSPEKKINFGFNTVSVDTTWQWHPIFWHLGYSHFSEIRFSWYHLAVASNLCRLKESKEFFKNRFSWYHLAVASNQVEVVMNNRKATRFQLIPLGSGIQSNFDSLQPDSSAFQLIPLGSGIQSYIQSCVWKNIISFSWYHLAVASNPIW